MNETSATRRTIAGKTWPHEMRRSGIIAAACLLPLCCGAAGPGPAHPAAPSAGAEDGSIVTYPVTRLEWEGGRRARVAAEPDATTPDGEPALRVTVTGPLAPAMTGSDEYSAVARHLPGAAPGLADRPVESIEFWFKPLDVSDQQIIFVVRPGYGERIPLAPAGWRKVVTAAFGPAPLSVGAVDRFAVRVGLVPDGARFLLGPVRTRVDLHPPQWRPAAHPPFVVNGLPWLEENKGALVRLPERARSIDANVWAKSRWPVGGRVRLKTDSRRIRLRIDHGDSRFPWPMMSAMSMAGLELYQGPPTRMEFVHVTTPATGQGVYEARLLEGGPGEMREYTIYLPAYAALAALDIGLDPGAALAAPTPFRAERPVAFYGTSFIHGAGASRPSMNLPAIIGRMLGVDFVNLGFSSEKRWETGMATFLAEIDAACYVVGPILNDPELMAERYPAFVARVRERRPDRPIILMTRLHTVGTREPYEVNGLVRAMCRRMTGSGDRNVRVFDAFPLYADGAFHPTIEGVHPTDLGFKIIADALAPEIAHTLGLDLAHSARGAGAGQ